MQVKDPAASTALEVVAGGKLYQVVVDTEVTGKALLSKGQLQKRVTIIPLNKIDAIPEEFIEEKRAELAAASGAPVIAISGATGLGVEAALRRLRETILAAREAEAEANRPRVETWKP